jgi:hypothetical protein
MGTARKVTDTETSSHATLLKELCEVLERRELTPVRLLAYRTAVDAWPVDALSLVMQTIYSQSPMPREMPAPEELHELVRRHAAPTAPPTPAMDASDDESVLDLASRQAMARIMTPGARALLRIATPHLLEGFPISEDEAQAVIRLYRSTAVTDATDHDEAIVPRRTTRLPRDNTWVLDYAKRREVVASAGYRWQALIGLWRRGKSTLTDEQIDRMDDAVLQDYVGRR